MYTYYYYLVQEYNRFNKIIKTIPLKKTSNNYDNYELHFFY